MESGILLTIVCYAASTVLYTVYLCGQKSRPYQLGVGLLTAGFVVHTTVILVETVRYAHLPVNTLRDTLSFAAWAVAGVFLLFQYRYRLKVLGIFAAPVATATMVAVALMPAAVIPAKPIFKSFWLSSTVWANTILKFF